MIAKKLEGKKILITGAATGIGRETALVLAKHGADIAINFFPEEGQEKKAHELASQICEEVRGHGCQSLLLPADVSKEDEVMKMYQHIFSTWKSLDVLINNAGIQRKSPSHEVKLDSFMQVISTNAIGPFLCSREAIAHFVKEKKKGVIINNTSVHQLIPKPQYLSYSMSKGALMNLTKTLALEYAPAGIRVNSIAPGAISTPINPWSNDDERKKKIADHIPMKKVGNTEEIANAMLFLASDDSEYMTGQTIFVDGGLTLYPDFGQDWSSS